MADEGGSGATTDYRYVSVPRTSFADAEATQREL